MTGFFGLKGGYRTKRVGVFGKIRPGFQTYGRVITSLASTTPIQFNYGRRVNFALEMGGVPDYYATRRIALRFPCYSIGWFASTIENNAPEPRVTSTAKSKACLHP